MNVDKHAAPMQEACIHAQVPESATHQPKVYDGDQSSPAGEASAATKASKVHIKDKAETSAEGLTSLLSPKDATNTVLLEAVQLVAELEAKLVAAGDQQSTSDAANNTTVILAARDLMRACKAKLSCATLGQDMHMNKCAIVCTHVHVYVCSAK